MKWYMALNEGGTKGNIAFHTKLAVLSALKNTDLRPVMLYIGARNSFTDWLEERGVELRMSKLPYIEVIEQLTVQNRYSLATVGHWLRTNVCLEELVDDFVFYTDVDVLFCGNPVLDEMRPTYFSAAPQFKIEEWNYFNAGVMVVNTAGLRSDYQAFESYLVSNLREKTYHFHDQIAYNTFYRGRWERLPVELNWKPYWGINQNAKLIHFHGPKVGAIESILSNKWNWNTSHGHQIGSMFASNQSEYLHYFEMIQEHALGLLPAETDRLDALIEGIRRFDSLEYTSRIDVSFMDFRMFRE